ELAAEGLVGARVQAVINTRRSISGRYPNPGPRLLAEASIPIVDAAGDELFELLQDGDVIEIEGGEIRLGDRTLATGERLTLDSIDERMQMAKANVVQELARFVENTI